VDHVADDLDVEVAGVLAGDLIDQARLALLSVRLRLQRHHGRAAAKPQPGLSRRARLSPAGFSHVLRCTHDGRNRKFAMLQHKSGSSVFISLAGLRQFFDEVIAVLPTRFVGW
jgi:hypothetical protein